MLCKTGVRDEGGPEVTSPHSLQHPCSPLPLPPEIPSDFLFLITGSWCVVRQGEQKTSVAWSTDLQEETRRLCACL